MVRVQSLSLTLMHIIMHKYAHAHTQLHTHTKSCIPTHLHTTVINPHTTVYNHLCHTCPQSAKHHTVSVHVHQPRTRRISEIRLVEVFVKEVSL